MDPWIAIVVGVITSAIVTAGLVWFAAGRISERTRDALRREYEAKLDTLRVEWSARERILEARVEATGDESDWPVRDEVVQGRIDVLQRWIGLSDAIRRCAALERPRIARLRFEYRDVFSDELESFADFLRRKRPFLSSDVADRVTAAVEHFADGERELTGALSDEDALDDADAHRAIHAAFDAMARSAHEVERSLENDCRRALGA